MEESILFFSWKNCFNFLFTQKIYYSNVAQWRFCHRYLWVSLSGPPSAPCRK